jgi:tetratricopeptide (TPR) repeat protein
VIPDEPAAWLDGLRAHAEVRRLVRALSLSQRFHLYLVVCSGPRVARATATVTRALVATARGAAVTLRWLPRAPDAPSPEERLTRESATEDVLRPLTAPDDASAAHGVVHVVDATGAVTDDAWAWCFQRLNERRNTIAQRLHGELVLCVTPAQEAQLAVIAPDLWSIRSGTFLVDVAVPAGTEATLWPERQRGFRRRDATATEAERRRAEVELRQARAWMEADPADVGRRESVAIWLDRLGDALQEQGHTDDALTAYTEASSLIEAVLATSPERRDLQQYLVALRLSIAALVRKLGRLDDAHRILTEQVLPAVAGPGDERAQAVATGQIADILMERGQIGDALALFEGLVTTFERLGDARARAATMGRIADIYQAIGQVDDALRIRRDVELPVYEALGDELAYATTMGKIAEAEFALGRLDSARAIVERDVLPASERLGHLEGLASASWTLGRILISQNKLDEALPYVERAFTVLQQLGHAQGVVAVGESYVDLLGLTGAVDRAAEVRSIIEPIGRRVRGE